MKESKLALNRLKNILMKDKSAQFEGINRVLSGDMYSLLACYFDIEKHQISLDIQVDEWGEYSISMNAKANKIISPKLLE